MDLTKKIGWATISLFLAFVMVEKGVNYYQSLPTPEYPPLKHPVGTIVEQVLNPGTSHGLIHEQNGLYYLVEWKMYNKMSGAYAGTQKEWNREFEVQLPTKKSEAPK